MTPTSPDKILNHTARQVVPHKWALSSGARAFRRLGRHWLITRHVRNLCNPLTVKGVEHLSEVRSPVLIVANHTSHVDSLIVLGILPAELSNRVAITAAADRFYTSTLKSAWFSLRYNAYPIARGGGSQALAYSEALLENGWSLLIFPEGRRSRSGEILPFHPGPGILALRRRVPVVPLYIGGATDIMRAGDRRAQPAPVSVRVGAPLRIDPAWSVTEATEAIEEAVRRLAPEPSAITAA